MPFYHDRVYPNLVRMLGNPKPIREVRQRIIPWAQGKVLEIGVGSGANFVHYDPAKVSKLYARGLDIRFRSVESNLVEVSFRDTVYARMKKPSPPARRPSAGARSGR